jgi:hypothetical protein
MINQPWKSRNWFTYKNCVLKPFGPSSSGDPPRFAEPGDRRSLQVTYWTSEGAPEQTIDLTKVVGWEVLPNDSKHRQYGLESLRVHLSTWPTGITLHNQKATPTVRLAKWQKTQGTLASFEDVIIPQPELTQIDDFFNAMRSVRLLS